MITKIILALVFYAVLAINNYSIKKISSGGRNNNEKCAIRFFEYMQRRSTAKSY